MKLPSYELTNSDLEACLFALSQFPNVSKSSSDIQNLINTNLCISAQQKMRNREDLNVNELRILCACIIYCNNVCHGDIDVDNETRKQITNYMFTLSKLETILCDPIFQDK